jgi:hypothetical protein
MAVMGFPGGWQLSAGFYRMENALVMSRESGASSRLEPMNRELAMIPARG